MVQAPLDAQARLRPPLNWTRDWTKPGSTLTGSVFVALGGPQPPLPSAQRIIVEHLFQQRPDNLTTNLPAWFSSCLLFCALFAALGILTSSREARKGLKTTQSGLLRAALKLRNVRSM